MSVLCGFIVVLSGTLILHSTREKDPASVTGIYPFKHAIIQLCIYVNLMDAHDLQLYGLYTCYFSI